jgi:hypothetical protein
MKKTSVTIRILKSHQPLFRDFIAIIDRDDIWEAEKIGKMMRQWPEGAQFIYSLSGNFTGTDFENRTAAPHVVYTPIDHVLKLVFNSPVHGHACMFKRTRSFMLLFRTLFMTGG